MTLRSGSYIDFLMLLDRDLEVCLRLEKQVALLFCCKEVLDCKFLFTTRILQMRITFI